MSAVPLFFFPIAEGGYLISIWRAGYLQSRKHHRLDRDNWFTFFVGLGFLGLTTILLVPDTDIPWQTKLQIDGPGLALLIALSVVTYFRFLRKPSEKSLPRVKRDLGTLGFFARFGRRKNESFEDFMREVVGGYVVTVIMFYFTFIFLKESSIGSGELQIDFDIFLLIGVGAAVYSTSRMVGEIVSRKNRAEMIATNKKTSWDTWAENFNDELFKFNEAEDDNSRSQIATVLGKDLERLKTNQKGEWPSNVRKAVLDLVESINKRFEKETPFLRVHCSSLLRLAYTKRDPTVNAEIIKDFQETYENISELELDFDINTLLLRQEMHDFSESFMEVLADEAIETWSEQRFGQMWSGIRFDQLNAGDREKLKEHLRNVWQNKKKTDTMRSRALKLLESAKQYG